MAATPPTALATLPSAFAAACRLSRTEGELFERCRVALVRRFQSEHIWLTLVSPTATVNDIAEVFEFVEGNCDLSIVQLAKTAPTEPSLADLAAVASMSPPAPVDEPTLSFADLAATVQSETPPRAAKPAPQPKLLKPIESAILAPAEDPDDRRSVRMEDA